MSFSLGDLQHALAKLGADVREADARAERAEAALAEALHRLGPAGQRDEYRRGYYAGYHAGRRRADAEVTV